MPWALAGAAVGAIGSMSAADTNAQAARDAKNPWEGAEPWIRDNIATGQQLQQHYQQNPFNQIQQQGMQGLLAGYQHQNEQVIPGMLGFANRLMGTNYQRQPTSGSGGLLAAPSQPVQQPAAQQPMQMQPQSAPMFTPPPMQAQGPMDFNQLNPLYKDPAAVTPPTPIPEGEQFRTAMADALFPQSGNGGIGVNAPSLEEQYLRRLLGRPSTYVDVSGA